MTNRGRLVTWYADSGEFKPREQGILATCERIHMMSTGTADYDDGSWRRCREYLIERMTRWQPHHGSEAFDSAVKALVEVTLGEKPPHTQGLTP